MISDEAINWASRVASKPGLSKIGVTMSTTPKHQHVFIAPIAAKVIDHRVHPTEKIVFRGEDRERAKAQQVPDSGWIQFAPSEPCASESEPAAQPQFAVNKEGKMLVTLSTSGYDDKKVAWRVTGFLWQHHADIAVGYGTTLMDEFQGATFVFAVDANDFKQMEQELPEFEDAMNREYEAKEHPQQAEPTCRYDITIIVKKNLPGEFHRATEFVAKRNVNIKSLMGGPYTPKADGSGEPQPGNLGAITMQIDVPLENAAETVAAIRADMESQPDWFVSVREHGISPRRSGGKGERRSAAKPVYNRANHARDVVVTNPRTNSYFVESEHFGP
jgi:hypothetical protein